MDGDLSASTSSGATETTATLSVYKGVGANWSDSGENITVTNRDDSFSASSGDRLMVEWINGEWRPQAAGCSARNEIWKLKVTGTPTGGSFDIDVTVNSSQETLTFNYNWTAAQVKTEFATHSELSSSDLSTSGGPFPGSEIVVEFTGNYAKKLMYDSDSNTPVIDDSSLTGGTSPAAWIITPIPGYPGNANP